MTPQFLRAAKPETDVEKAVVRDAWRLYQLKGIKMKLTFDAGWPDRLWPMPGGSVFWIEFKKVGEEPRRVQEEKINWLIAMGHDVEVHDTYAGAMRAIKVRFENTRLQT